LNFDTKGGFVETGVTTEIHEDVEALKPQLAERDRRYAELEQHIDQKIEQALKGLLAQTEPIKIQEKPEKTWKRTRKQNPNVRFG
jgi:hypothetical protein